MKKFLTITLTDNREIRRDITLEKFPNIPFGAPANHEGYLQLCVYIATTGTTDTNKTNDKTLTVIAPGSIKTVCVSFENGEKIQLEKS